MNDEVTKITDTGTSDELLLAIDCGTQSVRALLIDLYGDVVAKQYQALEDYKIPQHGWLEHDADIFWRATAGVCQALWKADAHWRSRVRGVTVTTQRGTVMPVDSNGRPLHPAIIWLDQRLSGRAPNLPLLLRIAAKATGADEFVHGFISQAEIAWFAENRPDIHGSTHKYLLLSGWLNYCLTGDFTDSVASQVGYLPFDFRRQEWAADSDWRWRALDVRRDHMPDLASSGTVLGEVTPAAAELTGIPAGAPVIAAAGDKACEIIGSGATTPEIGAVSYGTTATINITTPHYFEAIKFAPPYPALIPAHYNSEIQIFRGYWMVNWYKEQFAHKECEAATIAGVAPETLFEELLTQAPPGSDGLILQPYWAPGVRTPELSARGAIIGFTEAHTRAHIYRAILEGLAYELRFGKERIEARSTEKITCLRIAGGGSQSDAAMQLTADIFNLPAERPHSYEASGVGAAIAAAVALDFYSDFPTAVAAMTRIGRVFEPIPDNAAMYDGLYRNVYLRMYERLAPLYHNLQDALKKGGSSH